MKKISVLFLGVFVLSILCIDIDAAAQDSTIPHVVATDPDPGEEDIPVRPHISATFSEEMDPSSITEETFTLTDDFGNPVPGRVTYAGRTVALVIFQDLTGNTSYIATVSGRVRDSSGTPLYRDYRWSFQTGM